MPTVPDIHRRGLRSAQPLATVVTVGTLYFVTDENKTERSNGTAWEDYSDFPSGGVTPIGHHTTHEPGGSDAMAVDAIAATGSLRTLGAGAQQATAGNDARLSDSRTPTAHATSHSSGGSDAVDVKNLAGYPGGTTTFLRADHTFAAPPTGGGGGLIGRQIFTSGSGTYTPTTGTTKVIVECLGAGGGGGGVAAAGGSANCFARGGGGGGWLSKLLTSGFSGATYSVGAKGLGGASGANAGAAGGNTTFTDTGSTVYTAGGGQGGNPGNPAGPQANVGAGVAAGGTVTNGDIQRSGEPSYQGTAYGFGLVMGGRGGSSPYGAGGESPSINNGAAGTIAGINAYGKGAGGSGAVASGSGGPTNGGNGSDGLIIIWEYA